MHRNKLLFAVTAWFFLSPQVFAASWDDVGPGVCAALCTCEDWGTCDNGGNGGDGGGRGWQWIDPAELQHKEELKRQWQEYRAKKAARSAAQREFRSSMHSLRNVVRKRWNWKKKPKGRVFSYKGEPFNSSIGRMLGITANPNAKELALAGIQLVRPTSIQPKGETTHLSVDGLKKFSAILDYYKERHRSLLSTEPGSDEELHFLLDEAAAHMSGHASRVSVQLFNSAEDDEDARHSVESFQATWRMIKQVQRDIRRSEETRMDWAKEAAREEADIDKLNIRINKSSGNKKARLIKKRKDKIKKVRTLRKKFDAAIQMENQQTFQATDSTKKLRKYPALGIKSTP